MKQLIFSLLALLLPALAVAQTDPLDSSYMPVIDQNPADYPGNIWITGPLAKVLRNTGSPGTTHWAIVYAAQNEFQSFQVHVQAPGGGISNLNVTMSNLTNSRTGTVISSASTDIVLYREAYLNITNKTAVSNTYFGVTGFYPDILIPAVDPYYHQTTNAFPVNVAANNNQSIWIDVHIPTSVPSGFYSGTVTVSGAGSTLATMPVVYGVWAWQMPSTATLLSVNGVGFPAMCNQAYGGYNGCGSYPGAGGSADLGVTLSQVDLATLMLDHRNTLISNVYPPFPNSAPYTQFESYYGPLLNGTPAHTATILRGAKANTVSPWFASSITQTTAQNAINEFTSKEWASTLFDYICDEPPNGCSWSTLISNASGPHAASPQVPTLVTTDISAATANGALNSIDWMVPIINNMDPQGGTLQRSQYNTWLAGSPTRKLFSYQSCESAGTCSNGTVGGSNATWPNYDVDGTPVANRAMEWLTYLHRQAGELYYDATYCWTAPASGASACGPSGAQANDPWATVYYSGGNGDGTLVYPGRQTGSTGGPETVGTANPIWLPSMRLKMKRDGAQDYEYMYALNAAGLGATVSTQINSWITNSYTFNNDPNNNGVFSGTITSARQALGTALHQLTFAPGNAVPPTLLPFSGVTAGTIQLNWVADGPGILYTVLTSTAPNPVAPAGAVLTTSNTYNTFLSTTGLNPNVNYYFRIQATTTNFTSGFTAAVSTSTLAVVPTNPSFDTVITASIIPFKWSSMDGPGTLYTVLTSTAPNPSAPAGAVVTTSNTYNTFLSSAVLNASTTYYFQVQAINNNGIPTGYTAAISTATLGASPAGLFFSGISANSIQFNWAPLGGVGTLYTVLVSTAPNPAAPAGAVTTMDNTFNIFLSTSGLNPSTAYYFQVRATVGGVVPTGYSLPMQITTLASANATPGLNAVIVYPNPAVAPADPTIRICPGKIESLDVTIFNVAGRVMNSSTQFAGPMIPTQGAGAGNYCYEYTWTGRKASGVYFAVIHAKSSGTTIKTNVGFAVAR